ncbi:vitelline membrane protein Vm32E-like [Condylostylus longicornis]|uniref:vitelline membrane protein Vm32E-like n=1 Tax=Condylostylus longicornis TaxID=2530218 RepID=UPI00244DD978|nr:vitelline membrane protein Vm32E-like [Condylostylus longicornis]
MKSIIFVALVFVIANIEASSYAPAPAPVAAAALSYGSPGLAPPCPKSILVSCAPSVRAVPCAGGGSGLGYGVASHGAYTENTPQYASPVDNQYAASQPQQYAQYSPYGTYQ